MTADQCGALQSCWLPPPKPCVRAQHRRACAVVASANAGQSNTHRTAATSAKQLLQRESVKQPWYIGFQTNERTLEWEESAQIQLLKIYVAEKSGQVIKGSCAAVAVFHRCFLARASHRSCCLSFRTSSGCTSGCRSL